MRSLTLISFLLMTAGMWPLTARILTDKNGRKIDAEIVSKQGDQVRIRRVDGKEFTVPVNSFSPVDQAFIQGWQPAAAAVPKPPAVAAPPKDPDERKYLRFIEDVVYVVEAGDKEPYSKRWISLPRLVMHSTDPALQKHAESTFADICKEAGLVEASRGGGDIIVNIGPSKELNKVAKEDEISLSRSSGHLYWIWWGDDRAVTRAVIYLCTDRVDGPEALDVLLSDMLGAFGMPSRSTEFDDCCMSKKPSLQSSLTPTDRKVINFYYTHVPPGTKVVEFRRTFKEHWKP